MAQNSSNYVHFISDAPVDTTFPDAYKSHLITDIETLKTVLSTPVDLVAFDTETTGLNPEKDFIVGFSFSIDDHSGYYVPVKHFNGGLGTPALDLIYDYMTKCTVVAMHNCRFDMRMMEWHGFTDLNLKEQQMWLDVIPYEENDKFKKWQREWYLRYDMSKVKYFDTQNSCFLSDTNDQRTSLKKYEQKFLGWKSDTFEEALGSNANWYYTDYNDWTTYRYASLDTIGTYNLAVKTKRFVDEAKMSGQLDNNVLYPVGRVEELLQNIDRELLQSYHDFLAKDKEDTQNRCWSHAGRPFNLGSVKEKSEILESLGVYTGSRTKSGNMATGKTVIEKALQQMDKADPNFKFMQDLVHYNNVTKQMSSYVDNIIEMCEDSEPLRKDKLRFNYKMTLVPTGRLAAGGDKASAGYWANLNIQNIPKPHPGDFHVTTVEDCAVTNPELLEAGRKEDGSLKDVWYFDYNGKQIKIDRIFNYLMTQVEWGKIVVDKNGKTEKYPKSFPFNNESPTAKIMEGADQHLNIRSIFKPMNEDCYIMSLDYSGQELKAAALLSQEPAWLDAFSHGKDAHKETAIKIWGVENYNKEKRKLAKAANFGIIYGMGAYTLASRNGMTPEEGEDFFRKFQDGLPVLFSWLSYVQKLGRKNGTVYTMFGRPRRVSYWYNHPDYKMHAFAERTCANTVVQGCLRYGSRVLTSNGLRQIGDIYKSGDKVKVWTGFRYADAIALNRGKANIVIVNTVSGNRIECDNRHKFKIEENKEYLWKDIKDLKVGDKLTMSYNNSQPLDIEYWYYLCGYILGDGNIMYRTTYDKRRGKSYSRYDTQIVFGKNELEKAYEIKEFLDKEGYNARLEKTEHITKNGVVSARYRVTVTSEKLARYLESLGMVINSVSKTKRITENLYRHIYSVMKGLYDSDGCKRTGRFHLANKELCDDIRLAYSMLGVKSYVRENNRGVSYYCQPNDVKSVIDLFNGLNKDFKEKYYTDEVKSIEFTDIVEDTYTMSVDDELHQFIAEGVINKNTAADVSKIAIIKVFKNILSNPNNFDVCRWHSTVHDEINFNVRKDKAKVIAREVNRLMTLKMPGWPFGFDTGLSFGNTWGSLFDFEYDRNTFEVTTPKWEDVGPKPVEYTGEVESKEEEKESSALINTDGEEFVWDI